MQIKVHTVLAAENVVGESIVWDDRRGRLCWVDIVGKTIQALCPASGEHEVWQFPELITSIGLRADGGAIVGTRKSIAFWEFEGPLNLVVEVEPDVPSNRLNEGAVAPDGSFWVGTMQDNVALDGSPVALSAKTGRIYRFSNGRLRSICDDRFGITNTFVWTRDGRLVTADSVENAIYSYEIDEPSNLLHDRQVLLSGFERGSPDGSCIDEEGYIWNCRVAGGGCVVRLSPDGRIDRILDLPCSWPTCCAFGGPDLATLYITSARFTMSPEHLATHPQEGSVFALRPGVSGVPANRFIG